MAKTSQNQLQAPHWVDQITTDISDWQATAKEPKLHVDDMKTPSGRVHTGSLRGVLLHDFVAKALANSDDQNLAQTPVVSTYVFNDMDPMDGLPSYLDPNEYQHHMGKPLFQIPAPELEKSGIDVSKTSEQELSDFKKANSFAEFYAYDFVHAFRKLGCDQEIIWSHRLYKSGQMDDTIRLALDNVESFRNIYQEVAEYSLPKNWYPFQVICPNCGKVGTTLVTDWDGEQVSFECQPKKVEWAQGCGYAGKVSPFGGAGKLLWKADWPGHWRALGINIEGAGKDHTSAGGSRDMANAICQQIYNITIPFDIPYEWIMIRGAKMSSSKGVGTSAREFTELFPPEVGRFLFVNKHYNQVIDFDPRTMAIPDLFDAYDEAALVFWGQADDNADTRLGRSFELSQIDGQAPEPHLLPRFRDVAKWMQHPELDLEEKLAEVKGSKLNPLEKEVLEDRKKYAQIWIERYAPAEYQLTPRTELPKLARDLTPDQISFVLAVLELVVSKTWSDPQDLQQNIFDAAKAHTLGARKGFQALYLALLGLEAGPRAAWLLLATNTTLLQTRQSQLQQLLSGEFEETHLFPTLTQSPLLTFSPEFSAEYPSATVGVAVIKGVSINKTHPELEAEKELVLENLADLTTQQLGEFPELKSYRNMYKNMGIDWHSRRPSPEALLRRVSQGKDLYTINTCVDAYNLIVMQHRVSVGAFDLDAVQFPTVLQVAKGGEEILLLGDTTPTILKPGEISYFDTTGPYNLDYNYRDAQRTLVTDTTTNLLINVDGVYDITRDQVEQSLQETIDIIVKYCGGQVETAGIVTTTK